MSDDGRAPVHLGHRPEVYGEGELDVLALSQPEIRGLDEDSGRAQIDGSTEPPLAAGRGDIDGGPGSMPGVQAAFQDGSLVGLVVISVNAVTWLLLCLDASRDDE